MSDEKVTEDKINALGLNAPRVSPEKIDRQIVSSDYYVFPGSMMTVCCLTLVNGFNTVGTSACASPENFNAGIGRDIAFRNARQEIWALEGYRLKQKLYEKSLNAGYDPASQVKGYKTSGAALGDGTYEAVDEVKKSVHRNIGTVAGASREEDSLDNEEGA